MAFSFQRGGTAQRKRRARLHLESLESRALLSANLGTMPEWSARDIVWNGRTRSAVADSWIVRTTPTTTATTLGIGSQWQASSIGEGFFSLSAPGASSADVLGWAAKTQGVAYVEPNFVLQTAAVPNDPSYSRLWGLNNVGQSGGLRDADIDAPEAWNITTGSRDVVVAVIDSGVDYNHPDLKANMWKNPGEIPGDGIDNDNNGKKDDVYGWDFWSNDSDPMDENGHGTHVAGTIGAVGNNGIGVAGVNWNVSLMALKIGGAGPSVSISGAIGAVQYVTQMKTRAINPVNVVVSNNSWGGPSFSQSLKDAIDEGGKAGILFAAAAGNSANDNDESPAFPTSYDSDCIISVAATDRRNRLANFSNYGENSVDIGAPGVDIYSTRPNGRYGNDSGTSMAAPQVSGAIALLAAAKPGLTPAELKTAILSSAQPIPALAGKVATGGLLNVYEALRSLGPLADIVDVAPDQREDPVDELVVSFDRPVSGVDTSDFELRWESQGETVDSSLVGVPFEPIDDTGTRWRFVGLAAAGLTTRPGQYTLTLNHAGSGIVDEDDKALYTSATESWTQLPPDIGDTLRDAAPVTPEDDGTIQFAGKIGDGKNGLRDVDMYWVELGAGKTLSVDTDAHAMGSKLDTVVRIFDSAGNQLASNDDYDMGPDSFLSYVAPVDGRYFIGISSFGNTNYSPKVAGSGSPGRTVGEFALTITGDPTPPPMPLVADIIDVSPDPRYQAVAEVRIEFNRPVSGLTVGHFSLAHNGVAVKLDGVALAAANGGASDDEWILSGLGSVTAEPGAYTLSLVPNNNITDGARALLVSAFESWTLLTPDAHDSITPTTKVFTLDELLALGGRVSGIIGDGSFGSRDIDFYGAKLDAGTTYTIDIDARSLATPSTLDSVLRIFDANGRQLARNDDFNRSHDSYLRFTPKTTGTYYVGVSGYRNSSYNAMSEAGRRVGSTGTYEIQFGIVEPAATRAAAIAAQRSVDRLSRSVPKQAAAFAAFAAQTTMASTATPSNRTARGARR